MDQLSRSEDLRQRLDSADYDLVVVDEAHRMSAHYYGAELKTTKRYDLGRLLLTAADADEVMASDEVTASARRSLRRAGPDASGRLATLVAELGTLVARTRHGLR